MTHPILIRPTGVVPPAMRTSGRDLVVRAGGSSLAIPGSARCGAGRPDRR